MSNYVKFKRGTEEAYDKAKRAGNISDDTLYFLYKSQDSTLAKLYLGNRLISGGDSSLVTGELTLQHLQDILIGDNLEDDSILVYDIFEKKWINVPIKDAIGEFVAASNDTPGISGLVPAPSAGSGNRFLSSSGQWVEISGTSSQNIFTYDNNVSELTHDDIIAETVADILLNKGDLLIIRDNLGEEKWSHTAYVYNGNTWIAMDGNYNAANVYFTEDLITTTSIGNISLTDGQAKIPSAGKNLIDTFNTIFVQEKTPKITQPNSYFNKVTQGTYEVGTYIIPSYETGFNPGTYEFGPSTEVQVLSWEVSNSFNNEVLSQSKDNFDEVQVVDNISYKIIAKASHNDGKVPKTNIGNLYENGKILSGTKTVTSNGIFGYRKSFFGTVDSKENEITSSVIRGLSNSTDAALSNGSQFTINIPEGALRVIFAYPANLRDVTSVADENGLNAEISNSFTKKIVSVFGNNDYEAIDYKVYFLDYANPNNKNNNYFIQI